MAGVVRPKVVIIGAGFGGPWAARKFAHTAADVWMVDRNRLFVLVNWALDYIFYDQVVRLIIPVAQSEPSKRGC